MRLLTLFVIVALLCSVSSFSQQLDPSFNPVVVNTGALEQLIVQPDGKPLIYGYSVRYIGTTALTKYVTRLNLDGTIDPTFNAPAFTANEVVLFCALQADGKIVVVMNERPYLIRLNSDGTLDSTFPAGTSNAKGPNATVRMIRKYPGGKFLLSGDFTSYDGVSVRSMVLVNGDGSLNQSFAPPAGVIPIDIVTFEAQNSGKVLISTTAPAGKYSIIRLNANGTLDNSFSADCFADNRIFRIRVFADDKFLVGGPFTNFANQMKQTVTKLDANGNLDPTFSFAGISSTGIGDMEVQAGNKIMICGGFNLAGGIAMNGIARLNADGSLDPTFSSKAESSGGISTLATLPSGNIFITGSFTKYENTDRFSMARITSSGDLDPTFQADLGAISTLNDVTPAADGKVWIGGFFQRVNGVPVRGIARLNSDGSADASFNQGTGFNSTVGSVTVQPDGKIIVTGFFSVYNGVGRSGIARINTDGTLDLSFNPNLGGASVNTVLVQDDGKIILGGTFAAVNGISRSRFARLNTDGTLDLTFNAANAITTIVRKVIRTNDGKLIADIGVDGSSNSIVKRFTADGAEDLTFTPATFNNSIRDFVCDADGKVYFCGFFTKVNGVDYDNIAVLNADGSVNSDFPNWLVNGDINALAIRNEAMILAGSFSAGGVHNFGSWTKDGSTFLQNYYFTFGGVFRYVNHVQFSGEAVYLSGPFLRINGESRAGLAKAILNPLPAQAPTSLAITMNTQSHIKLEWVDNATFESGYQVEYSVGSDSNFRTLITTLPNIAFYDYFPSSTYHGKTVYYRVASLSPAGKSAFSNVVSAVIKPIPPKNFKVIAEAANRNVLSWDDVNENETGFRISRRTPGLNFQEIGTVGPNVTTFTNTTNTPNTPYVYMVASLTPDGNGDSQIAAPTLEGFWKDEIVFPGGPRRMAFSFGYGDNIYYGGGTNATGLRDFWAYNTKTKVWTRKPDFPGLASFGYASSPRFQGGFVVGGLADDLSYVDEVWYYDISFNVWTKSKPFNSGPIYGATCVDQNGTLYLFGGRGVVEATQKCWRYVLNDQSWVPIADFPGQPRVYGTGFSVGSNIYFGLGSGGAGDLKDFWQYNTLSNVWTQLADFPAEARSFSSGAVLADKGYIVGGSSGNTLFADVWEFNGTNHSWKKCADLPQTLTAASVASLDYSFYLTGGESSSANVSDKVRKFDPFIKKPDAPSALTADVTQHGDIRLDWTNASAFEERFVIERSQNETTGYDSINFVAFGANSFLDVTPVAGVQYYYRVLAANRAGKSESDVVSYLITDVDDEGVEVVEVVAYPNPTTGVIKISNTTMIKSLILSDVNGRVVQQCENINATSCELDFHQFADGFYIIRILDAKRERTVKVIKTH